MPRLFFRPFAAATLALVGVLGCSANDTVSDETLAYEAPSFDPNEVICKRQRPIGSHIPVRVCRTRAQIEQDRENALRATGGLRTMGGSEPRLPPSPPPN